MSGWLDLRVGDRVDGVARARVFPAAVFADPERIGWNLFRTAPSAEALAAERLGERGVGSYFPKRNRVVKVRCGTGRRRWREEVEEVPAFAGYLLVEEQAGGLDQVREIAGSSLRGVVTIGGVPVHVRRSVVERIRAQEAARVFDDRSRVHSVALGALVTITSGPFEGIKGMVQRVPAQPGEECQVWIRFGTVNVGLDEIELV